ncbi:MAG: hypothetical protein LBG27_11955, partial [Spirochaetaceae bacterium]|nr:hypothetical protein [Spirochaetaceae bacterium]
TFLGLCAEGLLKGISKDRCATDSVERQYARQAVDWLREHRDTAITPKQLWDKIGNAHIRYDRQMHIVLALWCAGLIEDGEGGVYV